ncbi:helix-hairpin-helix domain-containing protein [Arthrobacter sp. R4-81]
MSRRNPGAAPSADRARRVLAGNGSPEAGGLLDGTAFVDGHDFVESADSRQPRRTRWRTGPRAGLLVAFTAVILAGWFWWSAAANSPQVVPISAVSSAAGASQSPPAADSGTSVSESAADEGKEVGGVEIVIHVAGAVHTPGVVELPTGSRIHEAIRGAGGSLPGADLDRLNLAAVVTDGQKVHVPLVGEQLSADPVNDADGDAAGSGAATTDRMNVNTASVDELDTLPKVGPVLAQRIVDWRKEHGNFKTVEELDAVDGVGPKMLEALLLLVTV